MRKIASLFLLLTLLSPVRVLAQPLFAYEKYCSTETNFFNCYTNRGTRTRLIVDRPNFPLSSDTTVASTITIERRGNGSIDCGTAVLTDNGPINADDGNLFPNCSSSELIFSGNTLLQQNGYKVSWFDDSSIAVAVVPIGHLNTATETTNNKDQNSGYPGIDENGLILPGIVPGAHAHTVAIGAPAAGSVARPGQWYIDSTNHIPYFSDDAAGSNFRSLLDLPIDRYDQVTGDSGADTAVGSDVLQVTGLDTIKTIDTVASAGKISLRSKLLVHATDCTSLSGYKSGQACWEQDSNTIYVCEPTSGDCDTPGEWIAASTTIHALSTFRPQMNEPPAASFATVDTRNSHPILKFVDASDTSAVFSDVMSRDYSGGNVIVDIYFSSDVTTNAIGWCAAFELLGTSQDMDADSFATAQCASTAVSGTSGVLAVSEITFTSSQIDSVIAGSGFRLKITRDGDGSSVTDSCTGVGQVRFVEVRQ